MSRRVACFLFCICATTLSLRTFLQAATSTIKITSPTAKQVFVLSNGSLPSTTVLIAATTSPANYPTGWQFSATYRTRGTVSFPQVNLGGISLAAGKQGGFSVFEAGGSIAIAVSVSNPTGASSTSAYIVGANPSESTITSTLVSLYQSSSRFPRSGTPRLLTGLAAKESSYSQFATFKHPTYGITAAWPNDNAAAPGGGGGYIGLMQVPSSMSTAFSWMQNIKTGVSIFSDKLGTATSLMNSAMKAHSKLPALRDTQIEDNALVYYGPYGGSGGYWVPNSSGTAWVQTSSNSGGVSYVVYIRGHMH